MVIFGYEIIVRKVANSKLQYLSTKEVDRLLASGLYGFDRKGLPRTMARMRAVQNLFPGTGMREAKAWVESQVWKD